MSGQHDESPPKASRHVPPRPIFLSHPSLDWRAFVLVMWQWRDKEVSGEELDWDVICLPSQSGNAQPLSFIWKTPFLTLCEFILASVQGGNRLGSWVSLTALEKNVRNVWILSETQQIWLALGQEHYVQIICFKEHHLYFCMGLISGVFSVCVLVQVDVSLFLAPVFVYIDSSSFSSSCHLKFWQHWRCLGLLLYVRWRYISYIIKCHPNENRLWGQPCSTLGLHYWVGLLSAEDGWDYSFSVPNSLTA